MKLSGDLDGHLNWIPWVFHIGRYKCSSLGSPPADMAYEDCGYRAEANIYQQPEISHGEVDRRSP